MAPAHRGATEISWLPLAVERIGDGLGEQAG